MSTKFPVGSLVKCREREWVVMPSGDENLLLLRPLGGSESETTGIYLPLGLDHVTEATFSIPNAKAAGDHTAGRLLRDAARLSFRSGAGPFRSLGRLSVRPRPYQLVPLLMALRQDWTRLLIADDVGIGKTVEAGVIARELLDRGDATGLCVVCPPHLCDQWQRELAEKFHIDAVVIRSSTIGQLERALPGQHISVFAHYRYQVVSIDYVKSDTRRAAFVQHCPDMVIVDEAHTCARPSGKSSSQQLRFQLLEQLSQARERHLLLLTATPHSGIEESFLSLLGLLDPRFATYELSRLTEKQRESMARHFVQRRRADIRRWLDEETRFPDREQLEAFYDLTPEYDQLYKDVFAFAREQVQSAETLRGFKQRVRYWAALALLRCVMSSPASARAALIARAKGKEEDGTDEAPDFTPAVYDPTGEQDNDDINPTHVMQAGEEEMADSEKRRLREFARRAEELEGDKDGKVGKLAEIVTGLLKEKYSPIIYCRYIATAEYVAEELRRRLTSRLPDLRIIAVTGSMAEDEREARVAELAQSQARLLVATDCLSEGINLQHAFDAVVHYDLPWNPNRLEQREGRVDRFGQDRAKVKTILYYGRENPIDGAVLEVLLRKARTIHKSLGITVPLPVNSEDVMTAVLQSLFHKTESKTTGRTHRQMTLDEVMSGSDIPDIDGLHKRWDSAVQQEQASRTRFAQNAIKPDEVAAELRETDAVLGEPAAVEHFVRAALERMGAPLQPDGKGWRLNPVGLPRPVRERVGATRPITISFETTPPRGALYVGRNHPLTAALAEYLLDQALDVNQVHPHAARGGVTRTDAVKGRTTLMLLRIRYLLERRGKEPFLAEETVVCGYRGRPDSLEWLSEAEALRVLAEAEPRENLNPQQREQLLGPATEALPLLGVNLERIAQERADRLHEAHQRVRKAAEGRTTQLTVRPQVPVDVLGLYVLMPVLKGVQA